MNIQQARVLPQSRVFQQTRVLQLARVLQQPGVLQLARVLHQTRVLQQAKFEQQGFADCTDLILCVVCSLPEVDRGPPPSLLLGSSWGQGVVVEQAGRAGLGKL